VPRPPRIIEPGETYHVFSRGSNRLSIFFDDSDFTEFLVQLARIVAKHGWRLYSFCLIPNHYHLLVSPSGRGLSDGMRELNGGFSRRTSRKYGRIAHLFHNRFGHKRIADEEQFVWTTRYIVMNPVEAGICARPSQWRWSSHRAAVGAERLPPDWLDLAGLLAHFEVFNPFDPRAGYRSYVENSPLPVSDTVTKV